MAKTTPRVEFCGGLGTGKTACAALLAQAWNMPLVLERFEDVPYWEELYTDPGSMSLQKDLAFLLSHADSMQARPAPFVCDFAMFQTVAYSRAAGTPADTNAVDAVYQGLTERLGSPGIVVRLHCATEVQLSRIANRGRLPEQGIGPGYLKKLDDAIDEQIGRLPSGIEVVDLDVTIERPAGLVQRLVADLKLRS